MTDISAIGPKEIATSAENNAYLVVMNSLVLAIHQATGGHCPVFCNSMRIANFTYEDTGIE